MRTAVLLTGHMRSFERCLPTLHWHVLRHYGDVDLFVSTVADANAGKAALLKEKYPKSRVEIEVIDAQPELPIPPGNSGWKPGLFWSHEPYAISVHPQAILRQLWQLQRGWFFLTSTGATKKGKLPYDVVIRCRPDLYFHSFAPVIPLRNVAHSPWWGRFGGVNDRFAVLGLEAAKAYCTAYLQMPELMASGCPLHPESLIKAAVESHGCVNADFLQSEFSTLREDGTFRPPEAPLSDQVHAAMIADIDRR
jgi:hypothetical protein